MEYSNHGDLGERVCSQRVCPPVSLITTINAKPEDVKKAAKDIYKNYPELLKALGL